MNEANKKDYAKLFKTESGNPFVYKPSQLDIFDLITTKKHRRLSILCYSQFGKSMIIAMAVLVRAVVYAEKWAIIAPTKDKTAIVMRHLIQHLFDHPFFYSQLEVDIALERLKREKRRDYLTFRRGGKVFCLTAEARQEKNAGFSLLGEGAPNIVLDESPLISDKIFAFVIRMLGGSKDNFLIEVGNAFERNHFKRSFENPKYHNIIVDCYKGLEENKILPYGEGVLVEDMLEEARELPFFEQLYECKFPSVALIDDKGYMALIMEEVLEKAFIVDAKPEGSPKLAVDVGRGGSYTSFVARWPHYAKLLEKNRDPDLMSQVPRIERYMEKFDIENPADVFVDDIGVGGGITDRLREKDIPVTAFIAGGEAQDKEKFTNLRSECSWKAKVWLESGKNKLEKAQGFYDTLECRYKEDSEKKLKMEPKLDMSKRIGHSPDDWDALMMTFAPQETEPEIFVV